MALLTLTTPTRAGATVSGSAVASSDTISRAQLGVRGVTLEIINGNAGADAMTISDASTTSNGAAAAALAPSVPAGTNKAFKITLDMADPVTGLVTITHGVTATVTYKMYPRD